jgi:hypothetical protein
VAAPRIYMQSYGSDRPGTICCLARHPQYPGKLFLLSAGHVVAPLEVPDLAAVRRQRVRIVCELPGKTARPVATLMNWVPLQYGGAINRFDAGFAEVDADAQDDLLAQVPLPTDVTSLVEEGWSIVAEGAQTGAPRKGNVREGRVDGLRYRTTGNVEYADFAPDNHFSTDPVSIEGDSGAPAFDPEGRLAGLLVAGRTEGDRRSYFARIQPVLRYFGLEPVLHADRPAGIDARLLWSAPAQAAAAIPPPATPPSDAVDVFARTLWGEARGEGQPGIEGVASVVLNRARRGPRYWWGGTVVDVCKRPFQFSCWNPNDPNRARLLAVGATDVAFRLCLDVARAAVAGTLADPTSGATHYHVASMLPAWARGKTPCARIGSHVFYNDIE